MFERIEYLQQIIEKEASAHTYFNDYPPKEVDFREKTKKKGTMGEGQKMKKLYEDLMGQ